MRVSLPGATVGWLSRLTATISSQDGSSWSPSKAVKRADGIPVGIRSWAGRRWVPPTNERVFEIREGPTLGKARGQVPYGYASRNPPTRTDGPRYLPGDAIAKCVPSR